MPVIAVHHFYCYPAKYPKTYYHESDSDLQVVWAKVVGKHYFGHPVDVWWVPDLAYIAESYFCTSGDRNRHFRTTAAAATVVKH